MTDGYSVNEKSAETLSLRFVMQSVDLVAVALAAAISSIAAA